VEPLDTSGPAFTVRITEALVLYRSRLKEFWFPLNRLQHRCVRKNCGNVGKERFKIKC